MTIYKGSTKIGTIYKGSTKIGRIYKGSQLVYRSRTLQYLCFRASVGSTYYYTYIKTSETSPIDDNSNLWTSTDFAMVSSSSELSRSPNYKFSANTYQAEVLGFIFYQPATKSNINGTNSFTLECSTGTLILQGQTYTGPASNMSFVRYTDGDLYSY